MQLCSVSVRQQIPVHVTDIKIVRESAESLLHFENTATILDADFFPLLLVFVFNILKPCSRFPSAL